MSHLGLTKRRVRKGTRSCWECRRRKIKCRFQDSNDATCTNCSEYDTECISQKFSIEPVHPEPPVVSRTAVPDDAANELLSRRLGQLETMLHGVLKANQNSSQDAPQISKTGLNHQAESVVDLLDSSAVTNAHDIAASISKSGGILRITPPGSTFCSASDSLDSTTTSTTVPISSFSPESAVNNYYLAHADGSRKRSQQLSRDLWAILPSAHLRGILARESPGAEAVLNFFHSREDQIAGRTEPCWSLASVTWPTVETHPVLIARRLLQYALCMQQLPANFNPDRLQLPAYQQPCEALGVWVGAATAILAGNDELVGCIEGIEALVLLILFQSDAGHLRKAWVTTRRALTLSQLLGMHRHSPPSIRSCATSSDPPNLPSVHILWSRIVSSDCYHSLLLGLPLGSSGDNFLHSSSSTEGPSAKLCKAHAILYRKVAERNEMPSGTSEAYLFTQNIDAELQHAVGIMDKSWWAIPDLARAVQESMSQGGLARLLTACSALNLQVRHFTLTIFLHLPYLLGKGNQYEHNQSQSMNASRSVLERFLAYRQQYTWHVAGRHIDYSSLIAALSLCLGHLKTASADEVRADRELVEKTLVTFRGLGAYKRDRFSIESAETISQLLPILSTENNHTVKISVPFLGTVSIAQRPDNFESGYSRSGCQVEKDVQMEQQLTFSTSDQEISNQSIFGWPGSSIDPKDLDLEYSILQGIDTAYWSTLNQSLA